MDPFGGVETRNLAQDLHRSMHGQGSFACLLAQSLNTLDTSRVIPL